MQRPLSLAFAFLLSIVGCRDRALTAQRSPDRLPQVPPAAMDTLRLLFAGDAMQHQEQLLAARQADGSYRYDEAFRYVRPYIEAADLAIVNLETTLPGPPYAGYPNFRSPDAYAAALRDAGFDLFTLANNHSVDAGNAGVLRTLRVCDSLGVAHLGTYHSPADRSARTPLILTRRGIKLALLNYTYGTNYQFTTPPVSVNYIDTLQIRQDLAKARAARPDIILVLFHWGLEYQLQPLPQEEQLAALCFREGARLVIGGHPHVVRRTDRLTYDSTSVAVAYSLGNFLSAQRHPNTDGGQLVGITLIKDARTGRVEVADAGYHLVWVNRRPTTAEPVYELLPVADVERGQIAPMWEANGRAKMDRFATAARHVLGQSTQAPEMPAGIWLDQKIGDYALQTQSLAASLPFPTGTVQYVELPFPAPLSALTASPLPKGRKKH